MADEIKVVITGKDGVSKVFQEVSKSSAAMQKGVTQDASKTGTALNKMEQEASKAASGTSRSFGDMSRNFAVAGAAIGASVAMFSRDIVSNEQNVRTLVRTYGEGATQLQAFAQQMQSATTISSESAIESANIFGTLARNYGVSVEQIQTLMQVSADLAATSGLSIEDVSLRVQSAIRGEGESAEVLGLTMNQAAIDADGLTLSMTNQEAAAFRINALMGQVGFATGAAGEKADTTAGQVAQLNNSFQDMARGALGALGPLPDIVGGLTQIGAQSALALAGIGPLVKGFRDLATAQKAASAAGTKGGLLSGLAVVGEGGLAASLGAVATGALAVTAAFTPLIGVLALAAYQANQYKGEIDEQTDAITEWAAAINDPSLREGYTYLAQDIRDLSKEVQNIETNQVENLTDAFDELMNLNVGDLAKLADILHANNIEIGNLDNLTPEQYSIVYNAILQVNKEHVAYQYQVMASAQASMTALGQQSVALGESEEATRAAKDAFVDLWIQVNLGDMAGRRAASGLNEVAGAAEHAGSMVDRLADGMGRIGDRGFDKIAQSFKDIKFDEIDNGDAKTITRDYAAWRGETEAVAVAHEQLDDSLLGVDQRLEAYTKQAFDAAKAVDLLSTNAQQFAAAGVSSPSLNVAVDLQMGSGGFDSVMGAIKTAQSLSSEIGSAGTWADKLIGDRGVWTDMDRLLTDQRISVEEYNAAQDAQESITRDVTNAQEDLLAVQVGLAPAMADATSKQADYINNLQDLSSEQQLVALGYMNTATSAKAMELAQLAAASTTDAMQASTSQMIEQAAAADPVLKAMLVDMGLISATDGSVIFDSNAASVGEEIHELTVSIDALIVAMGGIPPIHTSSNAPSTTAEVSMLEDQILAVPDYTNTSLNASDNVSGAVRDAQYALANINGMRASTYLDNYQTTHVTTIYSSSGVGPVSSGFRHGGIPKYASGGMVTIEAGEAGAELARFANGGEAMLPRHGYYSIPAGTSIMPAPATKAEMHQRGSNSDGIHIGVLNIYPTTADIGAEIRSALVAGSRAR